jgi:hypothetical protein
MFRGLAVAFLCIGLSACSTPSGGPPAGGVTPPGAPEPVTPGLIVAADDARRLAGEGDKIVRLLSAQDLLVRVRLPKLPAAVTWVHFELLDPQGGKALQRDLPFASDGTKLAPYPHEPTSQARVRAAQPLPGGWALDGEFAIAGTWLQLRPQAGLWKVRASFEGTTLETTVEMRDVQ